MPNTFVTPEMVARDAAITLDDRLIVGNLVARDKEGLFTAGKVGDSVTVTVPPAVTEASEFSGTTSADGLTETEIDLTLEKHFYKRVDLTTKQKSLELSDFTRLVTVPAIQGIAMSIDKFMLRHMQVFRRNLTGTVSNRPSTAAHVAAANKALNDLFVVSSGRIALVDTTVEASLTQLTNWSSQDFGADGPSALREGFLASRWGFDFVRDANLDAFSRSSAPGCLTGSPVTKDDANALAIGDTQITIDGLTDPTGTIYAGTAFTLAGDTTRYVVRKDATLAGNTVTLTITPPLARDPGDGALVTFEAAGYSNLVYHPNAVAGAIVAPTPLAVGSSVAAFRGITVRVSMDSSITSLSDSIVYDVFCGCRVIEPNGGALFCG